MNNPFVVGIEEALEDYPLVGKYFERLFEGKEQEDPYKECLFLLLDVYKQWDCGAISIRQFLWAMGKLCEILDY